MKITSIEKQKNKKGRYNLFLDGEFACGISEETLLLHREIFVGSEIGENSLSSIVEDSEKTSAFQSALDYIARSERTKSEVKKKLANLKYTETATAYAIERLTSYGYLNDEDYVRKYATYNPAKGKIRLLAELFQKGVQKDVAEKVLSEYFDENSEQEAANALALKFSQTCKEKEKLLRRLLTRGYSYEIAKSAIAKLGFDTEEF